MRWSAVGWSSTETPSQALGRGQARLSMDPSVTPLTPGIVSAIATCVPTTQARRPDHARYARIRSGLFVRTTNACCGQSAITANTRSMNSSGTSAWKRSDIELTKQVRGVRHFSGRARRSSWHITSVKHRGRASPLASIRSWWDVETQSMVREGSSRSTGRNCVAQNRPAMVSA